MLTQTGICRFCGQSIMVESGGEKLTKPQLEESATMHCECEQALDYQQSVNRRSIAKQRAKELFGDEAEELKQPEAIQKIIMDTIDAICDKKMKSATITIKAGLKCRIVQMAKDKLKVVREISDNDEFVQ